MTGAATFDAAHFSDAVTKASKVAPRKGAAFDKAAGILFELDGAECVVSSTNLDVSYRQVIPIQDYDSDVQMAWRISSGMIATVAQSLNMDTGQSVTFIDRGDRQLRLKQDVFMAAFPLLRAEDFPTIPDYDLDGMTDGTDFSIKAAQVAWACASDEGSALSGVHISGHALYATDRFTLASVPCQVALDSGPITVPLSDVAGMLRSATDVRLRATDRRLEMALDKETKATSTIILHEFPKVQNVMRDDTLYVAEFNRDRFTEALNQMLLVVAGEKSPVLEMTFDQHAHTLVMDIAGEYGRVQNTIHIDSNAIGDEPQVMTMQPRIALGGIGNCRSNKVTFAFGKPGMPNNRATALVTDGSGYEAHLMPVVPPSSKG